MNEVYPIISKKTSVKITLTGGGLNTPGRPVGCLFLRLFARVNSREVSADAGRKHTHEPLRMFHQGSEESLSSSYLSTKRALARVMLINSVKYVDTSLWRAAPFR